MTRMTAAPHATRMTANTLARDRDLLAREADDIGAAFDRFARDAARGISCSEHTQLAQRVQQWLIRAAAYDARRDTAGLYNTELAEEAR